MYIGVPQTLCIMESLPTPPLTYDTPKSVIYSEAMQKNLS